MSKKTSMYLNLVSPTRGCQYTLAEVLQKGLERSSLTADSHSIEVLHECFYHSSDMVLMVDNMRPSASLWTESAVFSITGPIPLHTTESGKIQIGFGCGCDKRHGGQFPSDAPPDNPEWDAYKREERGFCIVCRVSSCDYATADEQLVLSTDIPYDDEAWDVLLLLVKELLAREALKAAR